RPQRFADLIGQDPIRTTLEQAVAKNRVAHAYLFAGPRGSGKTTTARLIAKALNCERRKPGESEPCNECGSCVAITNGTSLDVLARERVSLHEDAAGLIARASEGSVRDALGRLDQSLALSPEGVTAATVAQALGLAGLDAYFDLGEALAKRDPKLALQVLDRL